MSQEQKAGGDRVAVSRAPGSLCSPRLVALAEEFVAADAHAEQFDVRTIPDAVAERFNKAAAAFHAAARDAGLLESGKGRSWILVTREAAHKIYGDWVIGE